MGARLGIEAGGSAGIDTTPFEQLPAELKKQLENHLENQAKYTEELKEKYERLRVDSEQKYFELEKELIVKKAGLEAETTTASDLRIQVNDLEKKYHETSQKFRDLQQVEFEREKEWNKIKQTNAQLQMEKSDLNSTLNRKNAEIDRLGDEWKEMSNKVNQANKAKIEALTKLDEVQSKGVSLQHREKQVTQERDQLQNQLDWLNKELKEKSTELLKIRKEKSTQVIELQANLEEKLDALHHLEETVSSLRDAGATQSAQMEKYIQKLKDMRDSHTRVTEQFRNELQAQEKLTALHKKHSEESDSKVSELVKAVTELKNLLQDASKAHAEVENLREKDLSLYEAELSSKDERIEQLNKELSHANDLLDTMKRKGVVPITDESMETLSPSAAAASRLLKSGMTLTQIYSEYVQVSENLHLEQLENKRLNAYLDQILQEIEEKAPIMKKQREDYEKSMHTVNQLTSQLDSAMLECEKLQVMADDSTRQSGQLSRENALLRQQTMDLGQQVRMLLKELEEARGTVVSTSTPASETAEVSSSSQVISRRLVTFRSIEELQEQNVKLLSVVRELSEGQEKAEKESADSQSAELKEQIEKLTEEIEDMKAGRQRQMEMVESVVRQRDMYKVLFSQSGGSPLPMHPAQASTPMVDPLTPQQSPRVAQDSPSVPADHLVKLNETKEALKELQEEFNIYRREKQENENLISQQLDKFRQEASDFRMQNARLASQLDFSGERFKVLQSNVEGYKKEINHLRDRNQKMSTSVMQHEQAVASLRGELMAKHEHLARAEVQVQNLTIEKAMLKGIEKRLQDENETVLKNQRSQDLMLVNLQSIQNNLERAEFETKAKLSQQVEALEKENTVLRRRLDGAEGQNRTFITSIERQLLEARTSLEQEKNLHQKSKEKAEETEKHVQHLKQELSTVEAQFAAAESRLSNFAQGNTESTKAAPSKEQEEEQRYLKTKLEQSSLRILALQQEVSQAKLHIEQYKTIANSMEQNLNDQNKTTEEFKITLEAKLKEAESARDASLKDAKAMEVEKQRLTEENIKLTAESHGMNADLRKQLTSLQHELAEAVKARQQAGINEKAAKEDLNSQVLLAQGVQDKYERELILHAADVQSLSQAKQQLEGFNAQLDKLKEEAEEARQILDVSKTSWSEQEKILKADHNKTKEKMESLQQQNRLLHEELQNMSREMVRIQESQDRDSQHTKALEQTVAKEEEHGKSSEQLLEVIKYLRREKELAETSFEVIRAESTRLRQQLEYAERQSEESNRSLAEERQASQINIQTAAQHAELLRKVEQLNLLQDSNKLMRKEKDGILLQLREAQNKVEKFGEQIEPLQKQGHDLQAQVDCLNVERTQLREEVERWKTRTNHLIEQVNKADPEEYQRMIKEIAELKKQLSSITEERDKTKSDVTKVNSALITARSEVSQCRQTIEKLNSLKTSVETRDKQIQLLKTETENKQKEINALRTAVSQKEKEMANMQAATKTREAELNKLKTEAKTITDKNKAEKDQATRTIQQLKKIGKKYKEQAIEAEAKQTEMQKKLSEGVESKVTEAAGLKAVQESLAKAESEVAKLTEKLGAAESSLAQTERALKEEKERLTALTQQVEQKSQEMEKKTQAEIQKAKEFEDLEKKQTQSRNILQNAKVKLSSQKQDIEKLSAENQDLKNRLASIDGSAEEADLRVNTLKTQYEGRIAKLEAELAEAKGSRGSTTQADEQPHLLELNKLKKENTDFLHKIHQLQKQLESHQKPSQSTSGTKHTVSASSVERTGTGTQEAAPPTANIRPMSTPSVQSRVQAAPTPTRIVQSAPVQPVRSTSADNRAMASIRPLTVAPITDTTTVTQQTPTATVMPTTVSVHDSTLSISQPSPAQVRPTQQVQPVPSQPDSQPSTGTEATASASEPEMEPVAVPSLAAQGGTSTEVQSTPSTSMGAADSLNIPPPTATAKRSREEMELESEPTQPSDTPAKRTRVQEAPPPSVEQEDLDLSQPEISLDPPAELGEQTPTEGTTEQVTGNETQQEPVPEETQAPKEKPVATPVGTAVPQQIIQPEASTAEETDYVEGDDEEAEDNEVGEQGEEGQEEEGEEEILEASAVGQVVEKEGEEEEEEGEDDDVICVDSEEEEGEEDEDYEDEDEEEEEEEGEVDYDEEVVGSDEEIDVDPEDEEFQNEDMNEEYDVEAMQEGEEEDEEEEDEGDVVILDDDDDEEEEEEDEEEEEGEGGDLTESSAVPGEAAMEEVGDASFPQQAPAAVPQVPSPVQPRQAPPLARVPSQPGLGRAGLAPFMLGGESGFDDDAGIVPSTPTLFVPRRTDGFAEAVPSPQVQQSFQFGAGVDGMSQDGGQLASQALGVDDTRMDLSQFDDPSGRSTSASQQSRLAPSISVTEPSPPHPAVEQAEEQQPEAEQSTPEGTAIASGEDSMQQSSDLPEAELAPQVAAADSQEAGPESESVQPGGEDEGDGAEAEPKPSTSTDTDKDGDRGKPKKVIQKIVWSEPDLATPTTTPPPLAPLPSPVQPVGVQRGQVRRGNFARRGHSGPFRGRGVSPQSHPVIQGTPPVHLGMPHGHVGQPSGRGMPPGLSRGQQGHMGRAGRGPRARRSFRAKPKF